MKKNVAIIGASANREKFGNKAARAFRLAGYEVYPVNPHENTIEGLKVYPKISDIPEKIDIVSMYVKPEIGLTIAPEIIEKGVKEVYINPGAGNEALVGYLEERDVVVHQECSIRALGMNIAQFTA
ncbi:CoA-binding protein [Patescibacteria group bacterium]